MFLISNQPVQGHLGHILYTSMRGLPVSVFKEISPLLNVICDMMKGNGSYVPNINFEF